MTGAVDFRECPDPPLKTRIACQCGLCSVCGFPKHSAIHGPVFGQPPGSKPYGHEFVPAGRRVLQGDPDR